MSSQVLIVCILFWILGLIRIQELIRTESPYFLRAHEKQMLDCMGHTRHIVCIAKAADIDIDRGTRFVCFWVVYEKSFELIGQSYDSVRSVV